MPEQSDYSEPPPEPAINPPESPNPNRPKPPLKQPADAEGASAPAPAMADGQMDGVLKRLDDIIAQKLPSLVESSIAAKGIDKIVEGRVDAVVESRVPGQSQIDAMIVASVSKQQVKPASTGAPNSEQIDALMKKQAETEQRLMERMQIELQNRLGGQISSRPQTSEYSRPGTSPRPYSSEQQTRQGPQNKAAWTSDQLYTVAAVPNFDTSRALTHSELERDLTEKVLANQPDRTSLGFNEIIMRDVANSVVRELVGIFESLLDRLLMEKKQDTIRTMVAELLTEDTLKLIATSRDQLKQMELGQITGELERLGLEGREREENWEVRFKITRELSDSMDDLYATLDERCRGIENRLIAVEQNSVQRSELDQRFQHKVDEVKEMRQQVDGCHQRVETVSSQLAEQQRQCTENFVTRSELADGQKQLTTDLNACHDKLSNGLQELREYSASKAEVQSTATKLEDRLKATEHQVFEAVTSLNSLDTAVKKNQRTSEEIYCTKVVFDERVSNLQQEAKETSTRVLKTLDELEATKASKREVQEVSTSVRTSLTEINQTQAKSLTDLDRTSGQLVSLEQRVDQTFATRRYVDDSAKNLVEEVVQRSDTREELGRLWKELEAERERLRQTDRLQRDARNDLNEALENIQGLQNRAGELGQRCDRLDNSISEVDIRENSHFESGQEAVRAQRQSHDDLEALYKAFRDEFTANKEFHRNEAERLKTHSTMRYMEQIDKALNLQESVEKVIRENREIKEQGNIKLPSLPTS